MHSDIHKCYPVLPTMFSEWQLGVFEALARPVQLLALEFDQLYDHV